MSSQLPSDGDPVNHGHELAGYNFDFARSNTQYLTHGLHAYPARMIPQLPKIIFQHYLREEVINYDDTVLDPFAGSGTVGVEAQLSGLNAELIDLNPLACLISRAKTTPLEPDLLYDSWSDFALNSLPGIDGTLGECLSKITQTHENGGEPSESRPEVSRRFEWFPKPQLYHLSHIRRRIDALEQVHGEDIARFYRIALSSVAREVSYQRNHEYKRYRIPKEEWTDHNPSVINAFKETFLENCSRMTDFNDAYQSASNVTVKNADSRLPNGLEEDSIDLVLTSPPYGDHDTTVAYGQYSLDPAVISMSVERDQMKQVDKQGLGGRHNPDSSLKSLRSKSQLLDQTSSKLEDVEGRKKDALSFFVDYNAVLRQISHVLKPGQPAVIVVANRRMSGVQIPTHRITMDLLVELGFQEEGIFPRTLPYKALPYENSPSNIAGETEELMSDEFIVIARNA